MKYSLCNDWEFTTQWTEAFAHWQAPGEPVRLPHTNALVPQHYADPADYAHATALEALWGYLYLSGQTQRLDELMKLALTRTEDIWQKQNSR